ncbi:hypothetical protein M409DRAFT_25127 [Zasmidium cellare ATCC 36951]|uniref:AB hydrolase-1 domain-containing protein n=1 Tax=Zasmidium cellare ATCC 36951 TaxID=1080233 RepID=A0A6A6CC26_ZASCE|nr:uncharacterized protein M409DRAFT_25127 [Zasmidium cellare ATCC 36951]KAF2164734.1 hypothetical protein M409DRAFT_25127 [Zasmidium cellare ATCC 36951]
MPAKPTILFVPGAWHTEFHVRPVLPYLDKLGYEVKVLLLANLGDHNGAETKPGLHDSVEKVFEAMRAEAESGRDFVVQGHSAGGLVSAMAVNKFLPSATAEEKSRLKRVIFLAAFIRTSKHIISHWHHMDFKKGLSWPLRPEQVFYNDMSIEDSKPFCEALLPITLTPRPDEIDSLWHEIPRTFIVASKDEALLPYKQREEAEEQGFDIFELDSGHCPFISQPENFANVLNGIIQQGLEAKA